MKYGTITTCLIASPCLTGCNPLARIDDARKKAAEFHSRYDAGTLELIYRDAHPDMKAMHTESEFLDLMNSMRDKLGKVVSTSETGVHTFSGTSGSEVTMTFSTQYEKGKGEEKFNFRLKDGKAILRTWTVNSPTLLAPPAAPTAPPSNEI